MNVLSLFDGMSCGQQALERAGIKVNAYYASEIDKHAISVTMHNYPQTKQLGSVIDVNGYYLPKIDLLIGGSPCQSFSFAGKRKGMATKCETEIFTLEHYLELKKEGYEFEGQSYLFWEFMRLLNECKPKYFLLENVEMGEKWERVLSKAIGVNGIHINSALVSAQNRRRIYWTNMGMKPMGLFGDFGSIIEQPKDKGILLKDILVNEPNKKYFIKNINKILKLKKNIIHTDRKAHCFTAGGNSGGNHSDMDLIKCHKISEQATIIGDEINKSHFLMARDYKGFGNQEMTGIVVHNTMPRSSTTGKGGTGALSRNDGKTYCLDTGNTNAVEILGSKDNLIIQLNPSKESGGKQPYQHNRIYDENGISLCLDTDSGRKSVYTNNKIRRLTPTECERLQTVKDNYTETVSDTQRYRMLGNGWTVSVVAHIFSYLPKEYLNL